MAKWRCKTECYVQVSGSWGYYYDGDPAEGEISEASQKHFNRIGEVPAISKDEKSALQAQCRERGIKYHHAHGVSKLKRLLAKH
jgi:hypothetical protein